MKCHNKFLFAILLSAVLGTGYAALESLTGGSVYIDDLVNTNPTTSDQKSQGDDHMRGIKNVLVNTFPNVTGAITATQDNLNVLTGTSVSSTELSYVDAVTSAIQTQLNNKAAAGANSDITSITGLTTDLTVAQGGMGAGTFTDGGVLLGSGTGAITAMAVLTDGQIIVGDGTTDPVAESGATALLSLGAAASGANSDITALTGITGDVTSTKACATNYTRMTPNYCRKLAGPQDDSIASLTRDTCKTISAPDGDAVVIEMSVSAYVKSANSILTRSTQVFQYSDASCVNDSFGWIVGYGHEEVAQAAGAILSSHSMSMNVPLTAAGGSAYFKFADDAGNQGSVNYYIIGYYD